MIPERAAPVEGTLDREDRESVRVLGHRMLDDMLDYMKMVPAPCLAAHPLRGQGAFQQRPAARPSTAGNGPLATSFCGGI